MEWPQNLPAWAIALVAITAIAGIAAGILLFLKRSKKAAPTGQFKIPHRARQSAPPRNSTEHINRSAGGGALHKN